MKIINKQYQDVRDGDTPIQTTPITGLLETTELPTGSLMHIVTNQGDSNYESRKMTTDNFKQKIYEAVQNTFKISYWNTHEKMSAENEDEEMPSYAHDQDEETISGNRPVGTSFRELLEYLTGKDDLRDQAGKTQPIYAPEEPEKIDPDGFVNHIYYDFDLIKRYMVVKNGDIEGKIESISNRVDELGCYFAPEMEYSTTKLSNNQEIVVPDESVNHNKTENDTYCQMSIEPGNKISNEWKCTATGNLVIYGWLDASACLNNKTTPQAFCIVEANINGTWEVVSATAVAPAKTLTYVGFNLPVEKNLMVRIRTGFVCGNKSGQFSNQQDGNDTLSNSTPNGFKCMIYCGKKGSNTNDNT